MPQLEDAKYRAVVQTAVDAIVVMDANSIIRSFNNAATRMFGYSAEEAVGKPVAILMPENFDFREYGFVGNCPKTAHQNRQRPDRELTLHGRRKDGTLFPANLAVAEWIRENSNERFYTAIIRDLTEEHRAEAARDLLLREVDHRAKNALAVVQGLVRLTRGETKDEYVRALRGRIESLARAHSLLSQGKWEGAELGSVVAADAASGRNVETEGPPIWLEANAVQPVSMIVHELVTNALKYGSLSVPTGTVKFIWELASDGGLRLIWTERHGPPVVEPTEDGFGTTLLTEVVTKQLRGELRHEWLAEGLVVSILLPNSAFRAATRSRNGAKNSMENTESAPVKGQKILVVEDNVILGMEMTANLEDAGYTVVGPALTLEDAMVMATTENDLYAALLDIDLDGKHSFPAAEILKTRGVPFIFCTGFENLVVQAGYREEQVLRKPVNENLLLKKLYDLSAAV